MDDIAVSARGRSLLVATLVAATLVAGFAWMLHARPLLLFNSPGYRGHAGHGSWLLLHVLASTVPLFIGPLQLWSGVQHWRPNVHRWLGRAYLITGAIGVGGGAVLSMIAAHPPRSLFVATFTLAVVWFAAAAMAWRAIRNRRVDAHREWVIRSYVLTFTFVICRLAMRVPALAELGPETATAVVWLTWVLPLFATEIALQWSRGSSRAPLPGAGATPAAR